MATNRSPKTMRGVAARGARPGNTSTALTTSVLIGLGVVMVVVVVLWLVYGIDRKAEGAAAEERTQSAAAGDTRAANQNGNGQSNAKAVQPVDAAARTGKPPEIAAPALSAQQLSEADARYERAKTLWNDAQAARQGQDHAKFTTLLNDCWDELEALSAGLRPQIEWHERADLDGWSMPAEYVALEKRFDKWQDLRVRVKRSKPMERAR